MDSRSTNTEDRSDGAIHTEPTHWHRPVGRRSVIAGIAGLGIASGMGISRTLAQESTPEATDEEGTDQGTSDDISAEREAEIGAAYQNFVGKLAANLGETDTAAVDTAIRDALKAIVDEEFAAGNISQNLTTELKDRIDASPAPLRLGRLGGMRGGRLERRKDRQDDESDSDSDLPGAEATPSI